ncbi:hypothetical protein [Streptomyces sp. NBC_01408]|nr:hypothetical protein [Streptomyces sp. NBC_01408]MCX4696889.1 hypothetical protein [Streptomyces sp. NBC_01408]
MSISVARLHGEACWDCGAVTRALLPAGEAGDPQTAVADIEAVR